MNRNASVTILLRLEGLALGLLCVWLYAGIHRSWWLFAALFLLPDLAMLGYLAGARVGALAYNLAHSWVTAALIFVLSWWGNMPWLLPFAFVLGAHIGLDRALGLGLKLPSGFRDTHLGRTGIPAG